jgi:predicted nucleic acid-binding protein
MTRLNYSSILARVKQDRIYWQLVEPVPVVLGQAEELVGSYDVRTLDALHLASAIVIQDSIHAPLPFVTADERQLAAARQCKLETIEVAH